LYQPPSDRAPGFKGPKQLGEHDQTFVMMLLGKLSKSGRWFRTSDPNLTDMERELRDAVAPGAAPVVSSLSEFEEKAAWAAGFSKRGAAPVTKGTKPAKRFTPVTPIVGIVSSSLSGLSRQMKELEGAAVRQGGWDQTPWIKGLLDRLAQVRVIRKDEEGNEVDSGAFLAYKVDPDGKHAIALHPYLTEGVFRGMKDENGKPLSRGRAHDRISLVERSLLESGPAQILHAFLSSHIRPGGAFDRWTIDMLACHVWNLTPVSWKALPYQRRWRRRKAVKAALAAIGGLEGWSVETLPTQRLKISRPAKLPTLFPENVKTEAKAEPGPEAPVDPKPEAKVEPKAASKPEARVKPEPRRVAGAPSFESGPAFWALVHGASLARARQLPPRSWGRAYRACPPRQARNMTGSAVSL
jgi:hypothetical protein